MVTSTTTSLAGPGAAGCGPPRFPALDRGGTAMPPALDPWGLRAGPQWRSPMRRMRRHAWRGSSNAAGRRTSRSAHSIFWGPATPSIGTKRYVFHWNRGENSPTRTHCCSGFHGAGMHVVANLKPCLLDDHPSYSEAEAAGGFVRDGTGRPLLSQFWGRWRVPMLDFTSPCRGPRGGRPGWSGRCWRPGSTPAGTTIMSTSCGDEGRPIALASAWTAPLAMLRPVQSLLMTRATLEAQDTSPNPPSASFTVTRAGCPGIQRYAQSWSGDNTTSWGHVCAGTSARALQMSLSGIYNTGHDVGGFLPDQCRTRKLLVRWTQAGLFAPTLHYE